MGAQKTTEWIRARDALTQLTAKGENPVQVMDMLAAYLRNGQLSARANAIWTSEERFTKDAWRSAPEDVQGGDIPTRYWRLEKNMIEDQKQWRWVADRFLVTTRMRPRKRIMMRGVEFSLDHLSQLQPKYFNPPASKPRGKPPEIDKRDAGWSVVVDLLLAGRLNRARFPRQTDLQDEMRKLLKHKNGKLGLGISGIAEIARMVWPRVPGGLPDANTK